MRGTTLTRLLDLYRSECRLSLNPAHNNQIRDTQVHLLQRHQELLWENFAWPHLRIERQYAGQAGQRVYDFGADFDIGRIEHIYFKSAGGWSALTASIDQCHYATFDSDLDQRSYPVTRYKITEDDQVEVWPISDQNGDIETREGYFKVEGIRKLRPLIADTDRADLDDQLIVLFAAAETLGATGAKDAAHKLEAAKGHFMKLRSDLTPARKFSMFGIKDTTQPKREYVTVYRGT